MRFAVVEADIARPWPVGYRDIGVAVSVEVRHDHVSRRPVWIAERSAAGESPFAVIEQDELRVRLVIAQHDIEMAVLSWVGQWRGIAAGGGVRSEEHTSELQSLRHLV